MVMVAISSQGNAYGTCDAPRVAVGIVTVVTNFACSLMRLDVGECAVLKVGKWKSHDNQVPLAFVPIRSTALTTDFL